MASSGRIFESCEACSEEFLKCHLRGCFSPSFVMVSIRGTGKDRIANDQRGRNSHGSIRYAGNSRNHQTSIPRRGTPQTATPRQVQDMLHQNTICIPRHSPGTGNPNRDHDKRWQTTTTQMALQELFRTSLARFKSTARRSYHKMATRTQVRRR